MAPGDEGGGGAGGGGGDDAALSNGGGTNGVASAAAPVSAAAAAAAASPPLQPHRSLGGLKFKIKLPPRQPSGDGGGGGGGASGVAAGMVRPSSAPDASSLKRPAEGPPADAGGAVAPQKLKITLKGFKIGGGGGAAARTSTTTTPQGPEALSSLPGSVATSPAEAAAAAAAAAAASSGSKPKRVRSAKPPAAALPAPAASVPAPIYGGDSDAAVPWADEVQAAPAPAPDLAASAVAAANAAAAAIAAGAAPPPTTTATKAKAKSTPKGSAAASLPFIPAQMPQTQQRPAASAAEKEEQEAGRRASRTEASPGPSSTAAAAAAAAGGGRGGGRARSASRAAGEEGKDRSGGGGLEDHGGIEEEDGQPLPRLHPTRSVTREPVIRISDAVDPSVADVRLERNQVITLIEKVAKRDREGVFREVPSDYVAPGYSKLIANPVAFSTIRARATAPRDSGKGCYSCWDELCDDLDTMLDNCRAYNGPDSAWGLYADAFQLAAARMLQLSRAGVTDLRGKIGNLLALKQGADGSGDEAGVGVGGVGRYFRRDASFTGGGGDGGGGGGRGGSERGERGERGGGGGAATAAAAGGPSFYGSRVRASNRGGGGLLRSLRADVEAARDGLPRRLDDDGNWLEWRFGNKRSSYPTRIGGVGANAAAAAAVAAAAAAKVTAGGKTQTEQLQLSSDGIAAAAGGLARGHNGDGHALLGALSLLPSYVGAPPSDAYARSVARFAAGLTGKARARALAVAAASLPPNSGGLGRQQSVRPSPMQDGRAPQMPMPMAS